MHDFIGILGSLEESKTMRKGDLADDVERKPCSHTPRSQICPVWEKLLSGSPKKTSIVEFTYGSKLTGLVIE